MTKRSALFLSTVVIAFALILASCVKDKGKAPVVVAPPPVESCDTITYNKHIKKLVDNNCSTTPGCHAGTGAGGGGVVLETYTQVKNQADNGRIKARAIDGNPSFMPVGSQLTQAQKELITCWLNNGKKE